MSIFNKNKNELRELWNMLNSREIALYQEIDELGMLKGWIEKRNPLINPKENGK